MSHVEKLVSADLLSGEYRPVGCYLIQSSRTGKVLITQSPMEAITNEWSLPQGGFKYGESPEDNIVREMYEETTIESHELTIVDTEFSLPFKQFYSAVRIAKEAAKGRDTVGKKYYPIYATHSGCEILQCNPEEIANYQFVDLATAKKILILNRNKGMDLFRVLCELR